MNVAGLGAITGLDRPEQKKSGATDRLMGEATASSSAASSSATSQSKEKAGAKNEFASALKATSSKSAPQKLNSKKPERTTASTKPEEQPEAAGAAQTSIQPTKLKSSEIEDKAAVRNKTVTQLNSETKPVANASKSFGAKPNQEILIGDEAETSVEPLAAGAANGAEAATKNLLQGMANQLAEVADDELAIRSASMGEFLTKMQQEFGVEPEAIIKAFANLDSQAMMAAPEETAEAVLSQLQLTPDQLPKAERYYREMLAQTGESALSETMVGVSAGVTLKVLSEQDVAMEKLQKSIVELNDSFAMRNSTAASSMPLPMKAQVAQSLTLAPLAAMSQPQVQNELAKPLASDNQTTDESAESLVAPSVQKQGESKFANLAATLAGLGAVASKAHSSSANSSSQGAKKDETAGSGELAQASSQTDTPTNNQTASFDSIESALAAAGSAPMATAEQSKASVPLAAGTATSAGLAAAMLKSGQSDAPANMQDIVRQAQILLKNGGGEMKMQLKPEGIGDLHLKVQVKDGQVAVQMLTENDTAKKAIETGLDDLKTSLAQHKLHVDALKIEVGTDMAKQRFEQSQQDSANDANRQQARQMAQDFMSNLRQDRQEFRQGMFDGFGSRGYQQPRRQEPAPMEPVAAAAAAAKREGSSQRRLDLVA